MRKPILFSIKIDITNKDCAYISFVGDKPTHKVRRNTQQGGSQFWEDQHERKALLRSGYSLLLSIDEIYFDFAFRVLRVIGKKKKSTKAKE